MRACTSQETEREEMAQVEQHSERVGVLVGVLVVRLCVVGS
jgi:hypothetical protein